MSFNNISQIGNNKCYSCRSCEQICPKKCITMEENFEGFFYPVIQTNVCIDCGICLSHCPAKSLPNFGRIEKQEFLAVKLKDSNKIMQSASGGVFAGVAEYILSMNGVVFGAAFTDSFSIAHTKAESMEELQKLKGSKYVESDTQRTFSEVKDFLNKGRLVLYSGTPCQIAGLQKFLGRDYENLYTLDLICHGTPSRKLFKKYIEWLENKYKGKIIYYDFRDKKIDGWSCCGKAKINDKTIIIKGFSDPYYSSFLKSDTYKMSCYSCEYANINNRPGDLSIGDFWGVSLLSPSFYSKKGVSEIVINTEKGKRIFDIVNKCFEIIYLTLEKASYQNKNLITCSKITKKREYVYEDIDIKTSNDLMKLLMPSKKDWIIGWIKEMIPSSIKVFLKSKIKCGITK